jgi:hypothetical protein
VAQVVAQAAWADSTGERRVNPTQCFHAGLATGGSNGLLARYGSEPRDGMVPPVVDAPIRQLPKRRVLKWISRRATFSMPFMRPLSWSFVGAATERVRARVYGLIRLDGRGNGYVLTSVGSSRVALASRRAIGTEVS